MESQTTLILLPEETTKEENIDEMEQHPQKPSFLELIKVIVIFYIILGFVCYYFNKEWFNYLYVNPYNYLKNMSSKSK